MSDTEETRREIAERAGETPVVAPHVTVAPAADPAVRDAYMERNSDSSRGGGRLLPFLAGFVTAVVLGAIGVAVFLAVSDSDDDGNLNLDVPAVDVELEP